MRNSLTLKELNQVLTVEIEKHQNSLKGKSDKTPEWEEGFVAGIKHVREHVAIANHVFTQSR